MASSSPMMFGHEMFEMIAKFIWPISNTMHFLWLVCLCTQLNYPSPRMTQKHQLRVFWDIRSTIMFFFSYPHCMFAGFSWLKHGQSWIPWFFLGSGWYIFPLSKDPSSWFTQVISSISPCVVGSIQNLVDPGIPICFKEPVKC